MPFDKRVTPLDGETVISPSYNLIISISVYSGKDTEPSEGIVIIIASEVDVLQSIFPQSVNSSVLLTFTS